MFKNLYKKCLALAGHKSSKYYLAIVSFASGSVLTAAMVGPMVGSAALRVGAGDSRVACIETRATALHLAVLVARSQLPDHRMRAQGREADSGRNRCSQRR